MKIEAGKKYKDREGNTVEILRTGLNKGEKSSILCQIVGLVTSDLGLQWGRQYYEGGKFGHTAEDHEWDLVEEIPQKPKTKIEL